MTQVTLLCNVRISECKYNDPDCKILTVYHSIFLFFRFWWGVKILHYTSRVCARPLHYEFMHCHNLRLFCCWWCVWFIAISIVFQSWFTLWPFWLDVVRNSILSISRFLLNENKQSRISAKKETLRYTKRYSEISLLKDKVIPRIFLILLWLNCV